MPKAPEQYQPSPEEIADAESHMTIEQRTRSEYHDRQQKWNEYGGFTEEGDSKIEKIRKDAEGAIERFTSKLFERDHYSIYFSLRDAIRLNESLRNVATDIGLRGLNSRNFELGMKTTLKETKRLVERMLLEVKSNFFIRTS